MVAYRSYKLYESMNSMGEGGGVWQGVENEGAGVRGGGDVPGDCKEVLEALGKNVVAAVQDAV
jgi:hypothetical protein